MRKVSFARLVCGGANVMWIGLALVGAELDAQTAGELSIRPSTPTWQERVEFTASGVSVLFDGLEVVEVLAPEIRVRTVPFPSPIDPPVPEPYEFSLRLPRLDPGRWTVVYENARGTEIGRIDFEVFRTGDVAIEALRAGPEPEDVTVRVSGYACGDFELLGELTEFRYRTRTPCDFGGVPLSPQYFEFEEVSSAFPAGETIRAAVQVDLSREQSVVAVTEFEATALPAVVPSLCDVSNPNLLCLGDGGRFQATLEVIDDPAVGAARSFPPPPGDLYSSTGFFSIFDADNLEATVKVLDGCAINDHYWVFVSWGTTLRVEVSIADLETGWQWLADTPGGRLPLPLADVSAFPCALE